MRVSKPMNLIRCKIMKRLLFNIYVRLLVRRLHKIKKSMRLECYGTADCYVITRRHRGQKLFLCKTDEIRKVFSNGFPKCSYRGIWDAENELKAQRNRYVKQYIDDLKTAKAIKRTNEWLRKF